jgi:uncharacterized membrane protein YraQ (UPF0718 family)
MKTIWKKLSRDIRVAIILLLIVSILAIIFPQKIVLVLKKNVAITIKIMYLTIIAIVISTVIHYLIPTDFVEKRLSQNKLRYLFYATLLGILTPGPVYAIYPIVVVLKKKKVQNPIIVSYITGQTIIGPARVPLEVGLLGFDFFIYRIVFSLIMGPLAGLLYIFFSKIFPDNK